MSKTEGFAAMEARIAACHVKLQNGMAPSARLEAAQELVAATTEYARMLQSAFPRDYEQWLRSVS